MAFNPSYYPNLELLEYKVRLALKNADAIKELQENNNRLRICFEAEMFPQLWPSTNLGFDSPGTIGGQAFTAAYTTVFHELLTDIYVVCFGNDVCYSVDHAPEAFMEDLRARNMASLTEAKKRY